MRLASAYDTASYCVCVSINKYLRHGHHLLGTKIFYGESDDNFKYAWHFLIDSYGRRLFDCHLDYYLSIVYSLFRRYLTAGKIWRETLLMSLAKVISLAILCTHTDAVNIAVYGLLWISFVA